MFVDVGVVVVAAARWQECVRMPVRMPVRVPVRVPPVVVAQRRSVGFGQFETGENRLRGIRLTASAIRLTLQFI